MLQGEAQNISKTRKENLYTENFCKSVVPIPDLCPPLAQNLLCAADIRIPDLVFGETSGGDVELEKN